MIVVDLSSLIPVPHEVAVCPDCGANLNALPNEMGSAARGIDLWRVFVPTLYCQTEDRHGEQMTDEWLDTYDALGEWFETILVKCRLASSYV
jgi:hypothetical protein